jgi:acetyl-CoA/propionyl-CoA carboxylase biotin carboxyl carrier protein
VLRSVLVANRGEIALRVLRTCRRLGIRAIAVYSDADRDAPYVRFADEAIYIGPSPATQSYLRVDAIVDAAIASGAEAVHPGYGFLSENAELAEALAAAGIAFVGPSAAVIRLMGDKAAAKLHLAAAGVPVVPGIEDVTLTDAELLGRLHEVGYPLLLKAVSGGGGKGMRAVHDPADAADALAAAKREAMSAFGDDRMIVEKLISNPRHVEVQVMGDTHGHVIHVLERDCSLQRRHQKVVEEAPAAHLAPDVRAALLAAAVQAATAVDYVGAGTVEFLLDGNGRDVYFLEMNTRLQVEHPVTEMVTGLDLVELQLRAAAGEPLGVAQEDVIGTGHAMEVRLYAEDPAVGFLPQTGTVLALSTPPHVRFDSGIEAGSVVTPHYDPMLAKLIVHGADRAQALTLLTDAVRSTVALGLRQNLEWLGDLLSSEEVVADTLTTSWLDGWQWSPPALGDAAFAVAAAELASSRVLRDASSGPWESIGARRSGAGGWVVTLADDEDVRRCTVRRSASGTEVTVDTDLAAGTATKHVVVPTTDGRWQPFPGTARAALARPAAATEPFDGWAATAAVDGATVWLHANGRTRALAIMPATRHADLDAVGGSAALLSPMPGAVVTVDVADGDRVTKGQTLLVVEAMKMEHPITAPSDGTVSGLTLVGGDAVQAGQALVTVIPDDETDET